MDIKTLETMFKEILDPIEEAVYWLTIKSYEIIPRIDVYRADKDGMRLIDISTITETFLNEKTKIPTEIMMTKFWEAILSDFNIVTIQTRKNTCFKTREQYRFTIKKKLDKLTNK